MPAEIAWRTFMVTDFRMARVDCCESSLYCSVEPLEGNDPILEVASGGGQTACHTSVQRVLSRE